MPRPIPLLPLAEMIEGQEADAFVLLSAKTDGTTRDGKPFCRVTFRDAGREVSFPIWNDSAFSDACREQWKPGQFYKVRAVYTETKFGPQLDLRKLRPVALEDKADGFDEGMFLPRSAFDPQAMFGELVELARREIRDPALVALTAALLDSNRDVLLNLPAARRNHHAQVGGWLEHVLSVTRNALFFADKYGKDYPQLDPPLARDLVVAGAILHDIGKVQEMKLTPTGAEYTAAGELVGHILLGRDMLRAAAAEHPLATETLLRLEHIIISHQRLAEWGSPKPPMTPEAILVHFADDVDAKFHTALSALAEKGEGEFTSSRNPLQYKIFRGLVE
ncbi:MAG: HD domain-containing protein [Pirellulaceae bacterium]